MCLLWALQALLPLKPFDQTQCYVESYSYAEVNRVDHWFSHVEALTSVFATLQGDGTYPPLLTVGLTLLNFLSFAHQLMTSDIIEFRGQFLIKIIQ